MDFKKTKKGNSFHHFINKIYIFDLDKSIVYYI